MNEIMNNMLNPSMSSSDLVPVRVNPIIKIFDLCWQYGIPGIFLILSIICLIKAINNRKKTGQMDQYKILLCIIFLIFTITVAFITSHPLHL
ncbi:MAG: hypothetical protein IKP28_03995 [Clostridia bacterium]|nr:hypothetical protein [Clostridia bacterium]